ncbi:MAG: pteridine reductase [Tatlockia sp.]|nr:pteridine reductase [Tatlockia sp.]
MKQANKQVQKVALITGAARRIGAEISTQLHLSGFKVLIHCYNSLEDAQKLAETLNCKRSNSAQVIQQDLCAPDAAMSLIDAALVFGGRLDVVVNNASLFERSNFLRFNEKNWNDLFNANVKAPFLLSLAARPHLALQQGVIINITDIHAERPLKGYSEYCQSKAALIMQTKSLAREFAPEVRVNAVSPGAIVWPEHANMVSKEEQAEIISKTPLKRKGQPQYIAQAVLALVENSFITGQILKVDGGRSI